MSNNVCAVIAVIAAIVITRLVWIDRLDLALSGVLVVVLAFAFYEMILLMRNRPRQEKK